MMTVTLAIAITADISFENPSIVRIVCLALLTHDMVIQSFYPVKSRLSGLSCVF
jgi:hypothetical protein